MHQIARRTRSGFGYRLLAVGLALSSMVAAVSAESTPEKASGSAATVATGKDEYLRHCAICHGLDGTGNGPLADSMKIVPADLTGLSKRNQGAFPKVRVGDVIRNGGAVLGHGSTAMLPWGIYFSERGNPAVAKARIKALIEYIETLQSEQR